MDRKKRIEQIRKYINNRSLIWFGTRGNDANILSAFPELSHVFSLICPLENLDYIDQFCLEEYTRRRVDLNQYNLDNDDCVELRLLREKMISAFRKPSILITYRPTEFLTSIVFPNRTTTEYLGMFYLRQMVFEHKPWIENFLKEMGISTVPWKYYSDEESRRVYEDFGESPFVLRINRGTGGAGLVLIKEPDDIIRYWPMHTDGFLAATSYLNPNISISVNACLFSNGAVSIFAPSAQLIGLPSCTNRSFGFCGNDFAVPKKLSNNVLHKLEEMVVKVGNCLHQNGYLGAFGIDTILHDDKVLFAEVNPRFLASSPLASMIADQLNITDVYVEHMAAFMGLPPIETPSLVEIVKMQPAMSQIICYNRSQVAIKRTSGDIEPTENFKMCELPTSNIAVEPEGQLFKCIVEDSVTEDGHTLTEKAYHNIEGTISKWIHGNIP